MWPCFIQWPEKQAGKGFARALEFFLRSVTGEEERIAWLTLNLMQQPSVLKESIARKYQTWIKLRPLFPLGDLETGHSNSMNYPWGRCRLLWRRVMPD